jgi:DNA-binding transcriptional LysR family regulator
MDALADYDVDLVLVFRPPFMANFQPLMTLDQRLVAVMNKTHPLAAKRTLRLRDCARYPVALPERGFAGRQMLEEFCARSGVNFQVGVESNSFELLRGLVGCSDLISFQIEIGAPEDDKLDVVARDIDDRDVPRANLVLGQLSGRNLPVPAAVFAENLAHRLGAMRTQNLESDVA